MVNKYELIQTINSAVENSTVQNSAFENSAIVRENSPEGALFSTEEVTFYNYE